MKDCNACPIRFGCILACPEVNERLVEIDKYLEENYWDEIKHEKEESKNESH